MEKAVETTVTRLENCSECGGTIIANRRAMKVDRNIFVHIECYVPVVDEAEEAAKAAKKAAHEARMEAYRAKYAAGASERAKLTEHGTCPRCGAGYSSETVDGLKAAVVACVTFHEGKDAERKAVNRPVTCTTCGIRPALYGNRCESCFAM